MLGKHVCQKHPGFESRLLRQSQLMSDNHQVLFRKYRPQLFSEVIYQDLAVSAIQNAFKQKKIGHAYIFFGPRGVGKTSIARIFAKRLNCKTPVNNEPCNECHSCTEITKGISQDVLEIDAASNRGIDNIRELRENVKFAPVVGKYRVYIIDEVHMLSEPAFNALLKTLEEPPSHVVFILATTEFHKIPETILSRCQDFIFKKVPQSVLQSHIESICGKEGIQFDLEGLFWIARKGDGSVRDTLSFMEQAVVFTDSNLTGKNIREMIGYQGIEVLSNFVKNILIPGSHNKIFETIEKLFQEGYDLYKFIWDLLEFLNTSLLAIQNLLDKDTANFPADDIEIIKKEYREFNMESLNLLTENVFQMYDKINVMRLRNSQEVKIFLEIEFRKLIIEIEKPTVSGLLKKIADLTREIQNESQSLPANPVTKKEIVDSLKQKKESLLENKLVDNNDMNTSDKMEFFVKENFKGTDVDPSTMPEI
jgi:DNA polymerase-3 subunit gamma/tau